MLSLLNICTVDFWIFARLERECIKPGFHIVFIGDSRVRQLFCYIRGIWNHTDTFCKFQEDVLSELGGAKPTTMVSSKFSLKVIFKVIKNK